MHFIQVIIMYHAKEYYSYSVYIYTCSNCVLKFAVFVYYIYYIDVYFCYDTVDSKLLYT